MKKKVLIIAPHCDDDVIGMGAKLAYFIQNNWQVLVVFATDSRGLPNTFTNKTDQEMFALRELEAKNALKIIGKIKSIFLHISSHEIKQDYSRAAEEIKKIMLDFRPNEVYTTSPFEKHPTHLAVTKAVAKALKESKIKAVFLGYEVWTPMPDVSRIEFFDATKFIEIKKRAILAHKSQCQLKAYHESAIAKNRFNAVASDSHQKDKMKYAEIFLKMNELLKTNCSLKEFRRQEINAWLKELDEKNY